MNIENEVLITSESSRSDYHSRRKAVMCTARTVDTWGSECTSNCCKLSVVSKSRTPIRLISVRETIFWFSVHRSHLCAPETLSLSSHLSSRNFASTNTSLSAVIQGIVMSSYFTVFTHRNNASPISLPKKHPKDIQVHRLFMIRFLNECSNAF